MVMNFHYREYTDFLEDLEEDVAYRQNVDIYKGTFQYSNSWVEFFFRF